MILPSIERSCLDPEPPCDERVWVALYDEDDQFLGAPFIFRQEDGMWVVTA